MHNLGAFRIGLESPFWLKTVRVPRFALRFLSPRLSRSLLPLPCWQLAQAPCEGGWKLRLRVDASARGRQQPSTLWPLPYGLRFADRGPGSNHRLVPTPSFPPGFRPQGGSCAAKWLEVTPPLLRGTTPPPRGPPRSYRQGSAHYRLGRPLGRPSGQCSLSRAVLSYFRPPGGSRIVNARGGRATASAWFLAVGPRQ